MSTEQEQIQHAIRSLESQRPILGDDVVETTIFTLQEKLSQLTRPKESHRAAQRKQVTILFANVTGFTGIAESIPDTNMLDIMNVLWRRLDGAITNQGGMIDKHIGDGVMGLFGVPSAREDDPERAIRAALTMRVALDEFIAETGAFSEMRTPDVADGHTPSQNLKIKVGINTGPVLLGEVGTGDEYTVIGNAVNIASRLENAAKSGSVLISHDTYLLVRGIFNVDALGPISVKGRSEPLPVYTIAGLKSRLFYSSGRGVEGVETPMVGRDRELEQLQMTLQSALDTRNGRLATVIGEAGVGKSRLLHEFNSWVRSLPDLIPMFKARAYERTRQMPFSLIRDLFATKFNIQDDDPLSVVEDKLVQGMLSLVGGKTSDVRKRARAIAHLVGLDVSDGLGGIVGQSLGMSRPDSPQAEEQAFDYIAQLFEQIAHNSPAVFLSLEDLHWADASSLDLIDYVVQVCQEVPLVIISLARPSLFSARLHTGLLTATQRHQAFSFLNDFVLDLKALSQDASYQLVAEILRKLPDLPTELSEMIVEKADGNPFFVEELVKVLIDDGVLVAGQQEWQVQRSQLSEVRIPPHITGVLQARLDRLSDVERATLQRASVVGRVFWDTAVIFMNQLAKVPISASDTIAALRALEKREMVFPRQKSVFAGAQTYIFKHAILHESAYESVLLRKRPFYHKQVANWLAEQSGQRVAEYAGIIARHYELANERLPASELYEMAALRAQDSYKPAVATDYYCKSLSLLAEKAHFAVPQMRVQERLGSLLIKQSRFLEAAQTYMTMRYTAMGDGDLIAQGRAWLGLATVQRAQGNYTEMLQCATEAEQVAWLISAESVLTKAHLHKADAYLHLDELELAMASADQALQMSERFEEANIIISSLELLCLISIKRSHQKRVAQYLMKLTEYLEQLETNLLINPVNEGKQKVALCQHTLGKIYKKLDRYKKATFYLLSSLKLYRVTEQQTDIANVLNTLGNTMRLRGNTEKAVALYLQAMEIVDAMGDVYNLLKYRTNLGIAYIELGEYKTAVSLLKKAITLSESVGLMVSWHRVGVAHHFLALAYVGQEKPISGLSEAHAAYEFAQRHKDKLLTAVVWRTFGTVLALLPQTHLPAQIRDEQYLADDCYARSLQLLQDEDESNIYTRREQFLTLRDWARYKVKAGEAISGAEMLKKANVLAAELNIQVDSD